MSLFTDFIKNCNKLFWRRKEGVSIVEFAILAPVFIFLMVGVVQLGFILVIQNALDAGVREAGRYGITGQVASGSTKEDSIKNRIIQTIKNYSGGIVDTTKIKIYASSYADLSSNQKLTSSGGSNNFGGSGTIVNYLVTYDWNTMIPYFGTNGIITLSARATFRNENYAVPGS
jgi:Flp pilus assembly protein TadG